MNISSRVLETVKDKKGNSIPLLGYNFAIELQKDMFNREDVLQSAKNNGIEIERFKENSTRNSFKNALNQQRKMTKEQGKVINFVEEDAYSITFQLDRKVVEETAKLVSDSDGVDSSELVKNCNFITDTSIVFDKLTNRVICDNQELLGIVYAKLKVYQASYLKRNLSKHINDILESEAGMIAWRSAGGVYFVPAKYRQLLMNIVQFVTELDADATVKIAEVPDMQFASMAVKESAEQSLQKDLDKMKDDIKEIETEGDKLSSHMKQNRFEKLAQLNRKMEEYSILVENDLKSVSRESKKVKFMIENYARYGTVKSPVSEAVFTPEQIEELPEDIQLMLEI